MNAGRLWIRLLVASAYLAMIAAAQTFAVVGTLTDPSTSPVPDRTITLRSASREWVTKSNGAGEFRFDALPPGDFTLEVTVPGFDPISQPIRVGRRNVVRVSLRLSLARLKEEITVPDSEGAVSADAAANAAAVTVNAGALDMLPVLGLDYLGALAKFLDPGAGPGGTSLIVDGAEARNVGVTPSAIQEIRINQNPYTAEYPRWSRRRIEVITKAATDRYHGAFNYLMRDRVLNARDVFALERPPEHRDIFEGSLLGPLGSGKRSSFLVSGLHEDDRLQAVVFALAPGGFVRTNVAAPQRNTFASIRLSHQTSNAQSMFWQLNYQDRLVNNQGVGSTVLPEAGANYRFREDEFIFNHRYVFSPKLLSQFRILLGRYWAPTRSILNAPQAVVVDVFTGGGAQADNLRTEVHTSIVWMLTQTASKHTLKYGINVPDWSRRGFSDRTNRLGTFYFASLADYEANRPFSAQVQRGEGRTVFIEKNLGGFFQDDWQMRRNVSLALGLRYDWQNYFHDRDNVQPR
ncbi:MAG TPA: carboxypeptidase regulatory-like domain-containing protein, partial [Bryobacteraceae bacterium]|nr:carboxypeptidase regulatory-like domain-containing protein [Bryobacteraceae bacterium]